MRSMTGFGQARRRLKDLEISVELRALNGRYLDVVVRAPREMAALEGALRKRVQSVLRRGRAEVYVNVKVHSANQYQLNLPLLENYLELARQANHKGIEGRLDLTTLLQSPGILVQNELAFGDDQLRETVFSILDEALEALCEERRNEGRTLKEDLSRRIDALDRTVQDIDSQSGEVVEHYKRKLAQRLRSLEQQNVEPNRMAQEVLFYSEKADISEEITRLSRHMARFRDFLGKGTEKSVGKSLDFLCQEMNREANTILSKSQAAGISELALQGKTEVERIREQVQNVE